MFALLLLSWWEEAIGRTILTVESMWAILKWHLLSPTNWRYIDRHGARVQNRVRVRNIVGDSGSRMNLRLRSSGSSGAQPDDGLSLQAMTDTLCSTFIKRKNLYNCE